MSKQSERCFVCVPTVPLDWLEVSIAQENVEMDAKYFTRVLILKNGYKWAFFFFTMDKNEA